MTSTPRSKRVPLTEAKRSQLKSRLKPIVKQFKKIAKVEMVEIIDLMALIVEVYFSMQIVNSLIKPLVNFSNPTYQVHTLVFKC